MNTTTSRPRSPWSGVLLLMTTGLLLGLATAWALRPVSAPDTRPQRLLPAVVEPSRWSADPVPARTTAGRTFSADQRSGGGASATSWNTSRGYPVEVRPAGGQSGQELGAPAPYAWLLGGGPTTTSARWSPCTPLDVRVNPAGFDAADLADIRWALGELQRGTGLDVRLGDATSETVEGPLEERDWVDGTWTTAARRSWAPVLLVGSDAARIPELAGATTGWTHVHTDPTGGRLVSGVVALDLDDLAAGSAAQAGGLRMLLLHELGHLVGLGHVDDPDLVMHPYAVPGPGETPAYRRGDLLGLALAGRGPC